MTVEEIIEADPRCAEAYIKSKVRLQNPSLIKFGTWKKDVEVIVFCGPSQAGKSQVAENCAEFYGGPKFNTEGFNEITHVGGFWSSDRLPDSPIVIYDEFRDSHMKPSEFIRFIDYRKHDMNIKTSWVRNTWNLILITTVQRPESWWSKMKNHEESSIQWMRRIKVHNLYSPERTEYEDDVDFMKRHEVYEKEYLTNWEGVSEESSETELRHKKRIS